MTGQPWKGGGGGTAGAEGAGARRSVAEEGRCGRAGTEGRLCGGEQEGQEGRMRRREETRRETRGAWTDRGWGARPAHWECAEEKERRGRGELS